MLLQTDSSLVCPKCGEAIKLTESLAAPLVAAVRERYEQQLASQAESVAADKRLLQEQRAANEARAAELKLAATRQQQQVDRAVQEQVEKQLPQERKTIVEQEALRARQHVEDELQAQQTAFDEQRKYTEKLTEKLAVAQAAEAEIRRQSREFEDQKRELALNLQKGIDAGLQQARAEALREARDSTELKVHDLQDVNSQLREHIANLQRKAEGGSQQVQGESLELVLEHQLRAQFPFDLVEPVAKGEFGGDVLQHVRDHAGLLCGKILWESKRTKSWSDSWLTKLKNDQRAAHAELAVIVSQTMPKDVSHFEQVDGIWVSSMGCILPVASALRISLIELAGLRRSSEGQETKAQQTYAYLTGPRFKSRVECIVEKFEELRKDLDAEKKWMNKQWAKRDRELDIVLQATAGMYGDFQGIAGRSLQDIEALDGPVQLELGS